MCQESSAFWYKQVQCGVLFGTSTGRWRRRCCLVYHHWCLSLSRVVVWYKSDRGSCPPPSFAVTLRKEKDKEFPKSVLVAHEGVIRDREHGCWCAPPSSRDHHHGNNHGAVYNLLVIGTSTKIRHDPLPPQNEPPLPNPSDYKKDAMAWILGCIGIFLVVVVTTVVAGLGFRYALSRKNGYARKYDET